MHEDEMVLRVPLKKMLVGLCLTAFPLIALGLYTVVRADRELVRTVSDSFETIAVSRASRVSNYVHDRVIQVGVLAHMPAVIDAVAAADRAQAGVSAAAFQESVQRIEKSWTTPAADAMVRSILSSPASRTLRAQLAADPRLLRITLTDERGAVIAATHKTLDYYQADEDYWQAIYAQGRGGVNLTDILYDEVTKTNYIGIGVPVMEAETNRFIGTLDVLMDLSSIFPATADLNPGSSTQMELLKSDGTVIAGTGGTTLSMNVKSPAWAAVLDAFPSGRSSGNLLTTLSQGPQKLIAFADTGLGGDYKNLAWSVLLSQNADESLSPIRRVERLFYLYGAAGLAALVLLAVYFSLNRAQHYEDIVAEMVETESKSSVR